MSPIYNQWGYPTRTAQQGQLNMTTDTTRRAEFLQKLRALLEEYDVSICASYEGDTHGIHSERITIDHRLRKDSWQEETWLRIDHQTCLTARDIEET